MALEGEKSGNQISEELGINRNSVYKWIRQYKRKKGIAIQSIPKPPINKENKSRIRELEKKLKDREEEIEILKKAVHIFSRVEQN